MEAKIKNLKRYHITSQIQGRAFDIFGDVIAKVKNLERTHITSMIQGRAYVAKQSPYVAPNPDITLDASVLGLADLDPVTSMGFLTTANAPTYNTNAQNGLGVIKFDGIGNEMNGALTVSMVQFSYYMVVKYGTHKDNAGMMSVGPTGGNDWDSDNGVNFAAHGGASNVNQVAIRRGNIDNILAQWAIPPVIGDFFLLEGHIDTLAGTFSGRVNGGAAFIDTFDHLTPINPDLFVLGCRVIGGVPAADYSDMTFGEAQLYNHLLPKEGRSIIRNKLMDKWGL